MERQCLTGLCGGRELCFWRLSAQDTLALPRRALRALAALPPSSHAEPAELYPALYNAALLAATLQEGGEPLFADIEAVLATLSFGEIAGIARCYQQLCKEADADA